MSKRYDPNVIEDICKEYGWNEDDLIKSFIRSSEDFLDFIVFVYNDKITDLIESKFEREFEEFASRREKKDDGTYL